MAANEGWQPQSEDHLRILELLGTKHGVVALTKVGLAGDELADLAELEVAEHVEGTFLEGSPVVRVDVVAGIGTTGPEGLVAALDGLLERAPAVAPTGAGPGCGWTGRSRSVAPARW